MLDLDRSTALMLIAQTTFHPFTKADYQTYGGVESNQSYDWRNRTISNHN